MSVHWSSEIMKWEYRDLQATAMSVDYSGNNVLLAGRRWLAIKQLTLDDDAGDILKKYPRHSKYDAAGAEWCQSYHGQRLCAISSNQRVDVYDWRNGNDLTCICSLKGHTRVVSDTHFHRQDHNIIATCSIDTFTHLWDLRDARKPILSLCAVAGASQVQWNKVAPHMIATAHDGDIKIWDYRKHSAPIHYISAHLCKIHGVDWSPHHEYQLVTSSHDGSIKYFDINNGRRPENTIMTNFPVWRAIYTPFGSGLLTIGVGWGGLPRVEQAGVIGIWVGSTLTHRLVGHTDTVQTMVWRPNTQPSNYQLVTWGRDQTLRIWAMHSSLLKMCNHYLPDDADAEDFDNSDAVSYASTVGSMNDLSLHDNKSQDLQMSKLTNKLLITPEDEFESIHDMENIKIIEQDNELKTCKINYECKGYFAKLQVTFPKNVAEPTIPKFSWLSGTNLESMMTIKILKDINLTAHRKKLEGQKCLQPCLKTLITSMNEIPAKTSEDVDSLKSSQRSQSECENAGDACVPFPRTCGAKWCGVSSLVVFNRPPNARRMSLKHDVGTPRSMWSVQPALAPSPSPTGGLPPAPPAPPQPPLHSRHISNSITTFYFQDRWKAQGRRAGNMRSRTSISGCTPRVVVYDGSCLFPINKLLAERYIINTNDPVGMCRHNAAVCMELEEMELSRSWSLAGVSAGALVATGATGALVATGALGATGAVRGVHGPGPGPHSPTEECAGWPHHPLCNDLLQNLIGQYAKSGDVQMAAMLACAFFVYNDSPGSSAQSTISCSSYDNATSPYSTVNQFSDISGEGWTIPTLIRSNSCSEAENFYTTESSVAKCESASACVLDRATVHLYHCYKRIYADILHRWQLLYVRTEVMKLVRGCHEWGVSTWRAGRGRCEVCSLPVKGPMLLCLNCCHGGHHQHMLHWFTQNDSCPTGCGCKCVSDHNTWKGYKFT